MVDDYRRRERIEARFETTIETDGKAIRVETRNLSMKGVLLAGDEDLEVGLPCVVVLRLSPEAEIRIEGEVVRNEDGHLAVDFKGMDEDSFGHLHRLVTLNAEDPDAIDRQLTEPAFGEDEKD